MIPPVTSHSIAPERLAQLNALWRAFDEVKAALSQINAVGGPEAVRQAAKIQEKIDSFEPAVTMIGQIKAGKTALINSLVGQPGLLPSDVNPWTSVVTSLHLNSRRRPEGTRALFSFFDGEEWDRLVSTGGRLGELAQRAGFETEQNEVQEQVRAMREKSADRLGRRFEMLLGTSHNYETFDKDLIDRYVCHGGFEDEEETMRGRFADITKLAHLYLELDGYPSGLCLRDTPGVNDTFMMREQITINSIRDSRLCIVVLSAHQALSTMDMALLRLIANVDAREVVLFVNRIDELDDPAQQIPEIEANFRQTLKNQDVAEDVRILFGSAFWALHALSDTMDEMPAASRTALDNWATSDRSDQSVGADDMCALSWNLSGVPALHECIAERIVAGPGMAMLREVRDETSNLLMSIETADSDIGLNKDSVQKNNIDRDALTERLDTLEKKIVDALKTANRFELDTLTQRLRRSQEMFAGKAVEALNSHIETYGEAKVWQYNPSGLRVRLRTAYQSFGSSVEKTTKGVFKAACREYEKIYVDVFGVDESKIKLRPPSVARLMPPATVGQTIALDLNMSWWKKWWGGFRKADAMAKRYSELVTKETDPILEELIDKMAPELCAANFEALLDFIAIQRDSLTALATDSAADECEEARATISEKSKAIEVARSHIESLAA